MHEARGSYNGYFRSPNGSKDQFTLRQADEQSDKEFILRVANFIKLLAEQGWTAWEAATSIDSAVVAEGAERVASDAPKAFELESIQLAAGG
ncbi:MAG: hypothetical protein KF828_02665, partial [Anaerolineales bacterium]|nr:hypothetical protein [Anaerolineales bacterium]